MSIFLSCYVAHVGPSLFACFFGRFHPCPHTPMYVSSYCYVSSYYYICVLILANGLPLPARGVLLTMILLHPNEKKARVKNQQISGNVSSSGIYFYIYCDNYYFSFCTRTVTCSTKTEKVGLYRTWTVLVQKLK